MAVSRRIETEIERELENLRRQPAAGDTSATREEEIRALSLALKALREQRESPAESSPRRRKWYKRAGLRARFMWIKYRDPLLYCALFFAFVWALIIFILSMKKPS